MKRFCGLLLLVSGAWAGDLYQHIQTPVIDAYVDSAVVQSTLPGQPPARYIVNVSVNTTDEQTMAFAIVLKVQVEDGSATSFDVLVKRDTSSPTAYTPVVLRMAQKPVKVLVFYVCRMYQNAPDYLVTAL